jgi:hypothetical protein
MNKHMGQKNRNKLRGPAFPKATEGDWYLSERAIGEYLRGRITDKERGEITQNPLQKSNPDKSPTE